MGTRIEKKRDIMHVGPGQSKVAMSGGKPPKKGKASGGKSDDRKRLEYIFENYTLSGLKKIEDIPLDD